MTSHYANGRAFEYRVRDDLTDNGYVVIRAAGSKGAADLVAFKSGQVLFVSVKNHPGALPPVERQKLLHAANLVLAVPIHAYRPNAPRGLIYRELTGPLSKQWKPWTPDVVGGAA